MSTIVEPACLPKKVSLKYEVNLREYPSSSIACFIMLTIDQMPVNTTACSRLMDKRAELLSYLHSQDFLAAASNAERLASKLVVAVEEHDFYKAHQLLRTIYFRFINHRDKLRQLIDLLYHGAQFLLAGQEFMSGRDVATFLLESSAKLLQYRLDDAASNDHENSIKTRLTTADPDFHRDHNTIDWDISSKVAHLTVELPNTESGQSKFVAEAMKLLNPKILNRELLHTLLARSSRDRLDYASAMYHFLHGGNISTAKEIGELLANYHERFGNKNEVDLFLAQFVLQYLCMQNFTAGSVSGNQSRGNRKSKTVIKKTIELIIHQYKILHHQLSEDQSVSLRYPLFNFLHFITSMLDAPKPETQTFKALCDIYKTVWCRDPNYQTYLDRIGALYFGIIDKSKQQQQQQQGGFFNNILMSLLDGADDDDDMGSEPGSNVNISYDDLD